jgi:hypothetical protein
VRRTAAAVFAAAVFAAAVVALGGCSATGDSPGAQPVVTVRASASAASASPIPPSVPTTVPTTRPPARYVFPVVGRNSYAHTHHDYPATDIITKCGNRFVATTAGAILDVSRVDRWKAAVNDGATRGGLSVSLLGEDGVRYYGSHLRAIEPGITRGARVTAGQTLGRTGDTGDASACHLHFGISPPCARVGDWWLQRGTVYPWPYLDAWRAGKNTSAVAEVEKWRARHGCPTKPRVDP